MMKSLKFVYLLLLLVTVMMMLMVVGKTSALTMPNADPASEPVMLRGKAYYIHQNFFTDYQAARNDCSADGGMMAEIDDIEEYLTIQGYIINFNSVKSLSRVYIGGTDVVKDGDWRLPSTGTPLQFIYWQCDQPFHDDRYDCLSLGSTSNWTMSGSTCTTDSPNPSVRFMCEVQCIETLPLPESDYLDLSAEMNDKQYWFDESFADDCVTGDGRVVERFDPDLSAILSMANELPTIIVLYDSIWDEYNCVTYDKDTGVVTTRDWDCTAAYYDVRLVLCEREKFKNTCI